MRVRRTRPQMFHPRAAIWVVREGRGNVDLRPMRVNIIAEK